MNCFEIDCVYGQGAKDKYNTEVIQEYNFSSVISAKISFVINVVKIVHIVDIRNI